MIDKIKPLTSVEDVAVCVGIVVCRVPFCMLGATLFFSRLSVLFIVALFVGSTVVRLIDKIKPLTSVEEVSVCVGSTVGRILCKLDGASFAVGSAVFVLVRLFVVFTGSELSVLLFTFSVLIEFSAVLEVFESVFISSLVDLSVTFVLTDVFVSLALIAEVSFDFNVTVFS